MDKERNGRWTSLRKSSKCFKDMNADFQGLSFQRYTGYAFGTSIDGQENIRVTALGFLLNTVSTSILKTS